MSRDSSRDVETRKAEALKNFQHLDCEAESVVSIGVQSRVYPRSRRPRVPARIDPSLGCSAERVSGVASRARKGGWLPLFALFVLLATAVGGGGANSLKIRIFGASAFPGLWRLSRGSMHHD
jgi:hypothetical protein